MMSKRMIYGVAACAAAIGLSSAAWAATTLPMIATIDQVPTGKTVTIDELSIPQDGFVVIHATKDGKPVTAQYLGETPVTAGFHQNVNVTLDQKPKPGTTYVATLYGDNGQPGKFKFGPGNANADKPLMLVGKTVSTTFKIDKAENGR
jgi:hypothetical protein